MPGDNTDVGVCCGITSGVLDDGSRITASVVLALVCRRLHWCMGDVRIMSSDDSSAVAVVAVAVAVAAVTHTKPCL